MAQQGVSFVDDRIPGQRTDRSVDGQIIKILELFYRLDGTGAIVAVDGDRTQTVVELGDLAEVLLHHVDT